MDTTGYVALTRQGGLLKEMQVVANNLANMSTSGFRREGVIFAEAVRALPVEGRSVAMTEARVRVTDTAQGSLQRTGGAFDFAIEGDAFFMVETPAGQRLTRAGSYARSAEGALVSMTGDVLLDGGGAPIQLPPSGSIAIGRDGTVTVDGQAVAQIGLVTVEDKSALIREDGVRFRTDAELLPAEGASVFQGHLEGSNVEPVGEITRMIEVQRAYELGQTFLDREDQRIRAVVRTLGPRG
jgi:flagellar basal-body rod protein FlgF